MDFMAELRDINESVQIEPPLESRALEEILESFMGPSFKAEPIFPAN